MDASPLNPAGALAALAKIDLGRWGARGQLVCAIASVTVGEDCPDEPTQFSAKALGKATGRSWSYLLAVLKQLEAERVLDRVAGRGTAADAWCLHTPVTDWQAPWLVELAQVELDVGLATGRFLEVVPEFPVKPLPARRSRIARGSMHPRAIPSRPTPRALLLFLLELPT